MKFKSVSSIQPLLIATLCGLPLACDPAVTPEFVGDPIVNFRGEISGEVLSPSQGSTDVAVMWLTCEKDSERGCHFFSGGSPGAGIGIDEDSDIDPEIRDQCISECQELPECSDYRERSPDVLEGIRHCSEFVECINGCGAFVVSHDVYNAPVVAGSLSQSVTVDGNFPIEFQLGIYQSPSKEAKEWIGSSWDTNKNNFSNAKVAMGLIIAKGDGEVKFSSGAGATGSLLGVAESHIVIYAEQPIVRASDLGVMLGLREELSAGFHVMDYALVDCPPPDLDIQNGTVRCGHIVSPSESDLQTSISVRMADLGQLSLPLVNLLGE